VSRLCAFAIVATLVISLRPMDGQNLSSGAQRPPFRSSVDVIAMNVTVSIFWLMNRTAFDETVSFGASLFVLNGPVSWPEPGRGTMRPASRREIRLRR
jgi:hypothetical protein